MTQSNTSPVSAAVAASTATATITKVQNILGDLQTALSTLGTVFSVVVPSSAPIIAGTEAAIGLGEHVINAVENVPPTDAAALAAGQIASSTGNSSLDAKIAMLESFIEDAAPIIQAIAKHLGFSNPPQSPSQAIAAAAASNG